MIKELAVSAIWAAARWLISPSVASEVLKIVEFMEMAYKDDIPGEEKKRRVIETIRGLGDVAGAEVASAGKRALTMLIEAAVLKVKGV